MELILNRFKQALMHLLLNNRFIRSFNDTLYRIVYGLKQYKSDWVKHVSSIITKYNTTEHNTTTIKPSDAVEQEIHLWVNWHLQNNANKRQEIPYD